MFKPFFHGIWGWDSCDQEPANVLGKEMSWKLELYFLIREKMTGYFLFFGRWWKK